MLGVVVGRETVVVVATVLDPAPVEPELLPAGADVDPPEEPDPPDVELDPPDVELDPPDPDPLVEPEPVGNVVPIDPPEDDPDPTVVELDPPEPDPDPPDTVVPVPDLLEDTVEKYGLGVVIVPTFGSELNKSHADPVQ